MLRNIFSGIYCIENITNNKKYIGKSKNVLGRLSVHRYRLRNGKASIHIQNAWNKYGEENFRFYLIEKCSEEQLNDLEIKFIDLYKSRNPEYGYNMTSGGDNGATVRDEIKLKLSVLRKGKIVNGETRKRQSESLKKYFETHDAWNKNKPMTTIHNNLGKQIDVNRDNTTSKYRGVYLTSKKKWRAKIQTSGKVFHLGTFNLEEDAARAYDKKVLELFGEKAKLNFPI